MRSLCPRHERTPTLSDEEQRAAIAALLPGVWLNTNPDSEAIVRVEVYPGPAGSELRLQDASGAVIGPFEWRVPMLGGPESSALMGFVGQVRSPGVHLHIIGNFNKELLILAVFTSGAGSGPRYTREFFAQDRDAAPLLREAEPVAPRPFHAPEPPSAEPFVGDWVSVEPSLPGISRLRARLEAGRPEITLWSQGPAGELRWPQPEVHTYHCTPEEPGAGTSCLLARVALDFAVTELQIKVSKGLLVLSESTHFTDDSGRQPYFTRNFMRSAPPPEP